MREIPAHVKTLLQKRQMIGPDRPSHKVYIAEEGYSTEPFWEVEEPPEEWTESSFRPLKVLQGYSGDEVTRQTSNFVPTNDGRHMCAWISGGEIVMGYAPSEEAYLMKPDYPCTETLHTGVLVDVSAQPPSLFKRDDNKVLMFVVDIKDENVPMEVNCFISDSGNGDDFELYANVYTDPEGEGNSKHGSRDCMANIPLETRTGRLILAFTALREWFSGYSWRTVFIYTSDDKGATWQRRWLRRRMSWTMTLGQPAQLPDGSIFIEYQEHSGASWLYRSTSNGESWEYIEPISSFDGPHWWWTTAIENMDNRSPCWSGSFFYDEEMERLYRVVPGTYSGCGIYYLDDPNKDNVAPFSGDHEGGWTFFMYIHENNLARPKIWRTPKGRIAVLLNHRRILGLALEKHGFELPAKRINVSRSRTSASDLSVVIDNKDGKYTPDRSGEWQNVIWPNANIIVEQGYGQNLTQTFDGLIDSSMPRHSPGNAELEIAARDWYKLALDQTITSQAGHHTVTFVHMPLESIVRYLGEMAGFKKIVTEPTGITGTREFSQEAYADAMQALAEEVFFEVFCDEYSTLFFLRQQERGTELEPKHVFREGVDIVRLDYSVDDEDIYRQVIVYGRTEPEEGEEAQVIKAEADYAPAEYYNVLPHKVMIMHTDASTVEACQEIADRAVQLMLSKPRRVEFAAIGIPWLQVGDRVQVIESTTNISEVYRIDDMDLSQEPDSLLMTLGCHHYGFLPEPEE